MFGGLIEKSTLQVLISPTRGRVRTNATRCEKSSNTSEPPRHEANHGSVHQRLPARTRPLVVFAHPPVVVDPCQCPLHYPPTRQHYEALGGQQSLPIYGHALF